MRTIIKTGVLSLALCPALVFTSCSTTEDGSYVDPISLYEKIGGKWVVNSVVQTDELTSKTMTLTDKLDFDTFVILLQTDEHHRPTTFTVEGRAPALLPTSGTWTLDRDYTKSDGQASQMILQGGDSKATLTVTALPGSKGVLEYRLTRRVQGQPYTSYTYNLMSALTE